MTPGVPSDTFIPDKPTAPVGRQLEHVTPALPRVTDTPLSETSDPAFAELKPTMVVAPTSISVAVALAVSAKKNARKRINFFIVGNSLKGFALRRESNEQVDRKSTRL